MIEGVASLVLASIEAHANSRPRSLQADVGPSDLGDPCDHCLTAKLAGWSKRTELAWLPYIGTAVHEYVAQAFGIDEWLVETPTLVGNVDGREVWGTADLFHIPTRTVVDFKVVGQNTLRAAKRGDVAEKYLRQVQLYGQGLNAQHVAIMFLPRSSPDLYRGYVWHADIQRPIVALETLQRAERLLYALREAPNWYRHIEALPRAEGCYDCPRFEDWDSFYVPKPARSIMDGIMATNHANGSHDGEN